MKLRSMAAVAAGIAVSTASLPAAAEAPAPLELTTAQATCVSTMLNDLRHINTNPEDDYVSDGSFHVTMKTGRIVVDFELSKAAASRGWGGGATYECDLTGAVIERRFEK